MIPTGYVQRKVEIGWQFIHVLEALEALDNDSEEAEL